MENNYCSFGGLFICESVPGYFVRDYFFFFLWHEGCFWFQCLLTLPSLHAGCSPCAGVWPAHAAREMDAIGRAVTSASLLGP